MGNLNYAFFEEYKHLDKLCGELYQDQHGISRYIDDMKNVPVNISRCIPEWKEDLEQLIRLRHIRNHLAHTEGAFHDKVCTQRDIEWLQEFHRRIMSQTDSLALLYQSAKEKQQRKAVATPKESQPLSFDDKHIAESNDLPHKEKTPGFYWIILLFTIAGGLLLVIWAISLLLA